MACFVAVPLMYGSLDKWNSEDAFIVFSLYSNNTSCTDTEASNQNPNSKHGQMLLQTYNAAEQECTCNYKQRFSKGFSVCCFIGDFGLVVIMNQIGFALVYCNTYSHEEQCHYKQDHRIYHHTDASVQFWFSLCLPTYYHIFVYYTTGIRRSEDSTAAEKTGRRLAFR